MNDVIGGGETSQQNEALKHSFKNLKTQAKTLIFKGIGGVWQQCLLHRRELRDNGVKVEEPFFWSQKQHLSKVLESGGLVIRLTKKENQSSNTFFIFEPNDLEKGKNDMDLKSIIIDNYSGRKETYKIDFNDDGSIKITRTDGKGVETEISAEQFAYLKEIDAIKNILSTADDEVKKTVKGATTFFGASIAIAMVGAGIKSEIALVNEGLHTPYGNYKFLYEIHEVGIDSKDIPDNTNIFFRETEFYDLFDRPVNEIFRAKASEGKIVFMFPEILEKLVKNGTEIMVGDTILTDIEMKIMDYNVVDNLKLSIGAASIIYYVNRLSKTNQVENKNKHREFIKNVVRLTAIWGITPSIISGLNLLSLSEKQNTILKRMSTKIEGLQSNLEPEKTGTFIRNILMALKLTEAGIEFQKTNGTTANFCVELGGAHGGVEDLIQLGPDILRQFILRLPKKYLESIIGINGGIEDFSSSRIFKFPNDFNAIDYLTNPKGFPPLAERNITEKKVTDFILVKGLNEKFHSTELVTNK